MGKTRKGLYRKVWRTKMRTALVVSLIESFKTATYESGYYSARLESVKRDGSKELYDAYIKLLHNAIELRGLAETRLFKELGIKQLRR